MYNKYAKDMGLRKLTFKEYVSMYESSRGEQDSSGNYEC